MLRALACPDTSNSGGPAPITSYARRVPSDAVANGMPASWRRTYASRPTLASAAPTGCDQRGLPGFDGARRLVALTVEPRRAPTVPDVTSRLAVPRGNHAWRCA